MNAKYVLEISSAVALVLFLGTIITAVTVSGDTAKWTIWSLLASIVVMLWSQACVEAQTGRNQSSERK